MYTDTKIYVLLKIENNNIYGLRIKSHYKTHGLKI